jgi:hypothetical protein
MSKEAVNSSSSISAPAVWRQLFEAALLEQDHSLLPRRLKDAKNAVMDRIEESFDSASLTERKLLLAALNTISELQRLANLEDVPTTHPVPAFGSAA